MEKLKPCPFCGNDSTDPHDLQSVDIVEGTRNTIGYGLPAPAPYKIIYVRCGQCYARTGNTATGYNALTKTTLTDEQARQIAISKWNRRTGQEAGA